MCLFGTFKSAENDISYEIFENLTTLLFLQLLKLKSKKWSPNFENFTQVVFIKTLKYYIFHIRPNE